MPGSSSRKPRAARRPRKSAGAETAAAFDNAPVPMHEIDREGVIRRANRAECELLGFSPDELLGRHVSELVAPGNRDASRDAVLRKVGGGLSLAPFRRELTRRDGASLTVEIHEHLIRDDAGNVTGIRSVLMDVSEQQRVQDSLRQVQEQLEARVRARTAELARANEALRLEIAQRRRAEQRLAVQYAVARVLAGSDNVGDAVPRLLDAILEHLGWDCAVWWTVDRDAGALRFAASRPSSSAEAPRLAARGYRPGELAPGDAWRSESAVWIDAAVEDALGLRPATGPASFRGALVFPIVGGSGTAGVIAILCRAEHSRDEDLLRTASLLGSQIGQFVERKDAESGRDRSEARFTAFMDHLPAAAFMKDRARRYIYLNAGFESLMGLKPGAVLGRADRDIWPPDIAAAVEAQDRQVLDSGKAVEALVNLPGPKGNPRSWLVYKFPVTGPDGDSLYIGGVAVDVTERSLLEDQLRQSQKMDAIGRLAGGVAHDFNNLLTIIGGYGRMILDQLAPTDRARGSMELILNAADRAAVLTSQLLAFSRRQVVQPKILELNHVVSNLEKMLSRVIGEHIELRTVLDPHLCRVKADSGQIEQILMNLAINARDAMPDGGVLTIETAPAPWRRASETLDPPPSPHARLSVVDTGTGMDAQTRGRIFEPFFTTKGRGKGTGLGLSTVYGIVKQHGGDIVVDSEPGAGARFHLYFPAVAEEAGTEAPAATVTAPLSGTETILLVEDDAGVRRVARDVLRARGYRVLEAADGPEALRIAEGERGSIDLLLTDMIMPLMSGRELANRLQERDRKVRVVFMSGYTDDVIAYHGDLGPDATFVQKPFAPEAIARKVREVLDAGKGIAKASPRHRD